MTNVKGTVVFEDSNSVRNAGSILNQLAIAATTVLQAYESLNINVRLSVNDISNLIGMDPLKIGEFLRTLIMSKRPGPYHIGDIPVSAQALSRMIELPNYDGLVQAVSNLTECYKNMDSERRGPYARFYQGWERFLYIEEVDLEQESLLHTEGSEVKINPETFKAECDRAFRVILDTEDKHSDHDMVSKFCDFLNTRVIAKGGNDPGYWSNPRQFENLFSFNASTRRFDLNYDFFK